MAGEHLGFRVAYDGTGFGGFQIQTNRRTVQAEIERALAIFFRKKIRIDFSSRTDAGVSAYEQWVCIRKGWENFEELSPPLKERCLHSLNAILPKEIVLWQILKLNSRFHPKKSIQWKEYEYMVGLGPHREPLLGDRIWWIRTPLDMRKLRQGLRHLKGKHDFAAFMTHSKSFRGSTVREIFKAKVEIEKSSVPSLKLLRFRFRGSGFLQHMVRNMVGSLVDYARGRAPDMSQVLSEKDRRKAGVSAPAKPLVLHRSNVSSSLFRIVPQ